MPNIFHEFSLKLLNDLIQVCFIVNETLKTTSSCQAINNYIVKMQVQEETL